MEEQVLIKYVLDHWGIAGLLMMTPPIMAWFYHKTRMSELKASITEQKEEKADYKSVITGNTEAITKMAGALESNTQTIRDLRSYMERDKS